jgi:helicase
MWRVTGLTGAGGLVIKIRWNRASLSSLWNWALPAVPFGILLVIAIVRLVVGPGHALFADNFSGDTVLLTDDAATKKGLRDELARLAQLSTDDDVVVVGFSGHGSSTHALVPYDADRTQPDETFLPLDDLAQLLNQVRASTLVCILDCCFSGGFDAKVYTAPLEVRGLESEAELLEQIAGKGRIVLTASAANEPAYEDNAIGHGLLTYYLLTALQGAPEAVSAGKLDLYKLIEH